MSCRPKQLVAAGFLFLALVLPARAAEVTTIKVALTDLSSAMGMGPRGRGLMRPGEGMGYGGPGTIGPEMMQGMMAIRLDHPSAPAGQVRFDITNWSQDLVHNPLIIAVDNPQAPLPYDYSQAKVAEDQVKVLARTGNLQPNESAKLDLAVTVGWYLVICNVPGHYAAGMAAPLAVTSQLGH
jgi:uncharacterized cupredoxin-like copper-binding protein